MGKDANFFLLSLNIEMEGWELLFEVRYHFGWPGGGRNGQNCPNFIRDDPVGSSRKEKILTKIIEVTSVKNVLLRAGRRAGGRELVFD